MVTMPGAARITLVAGGLLIAAAWTIGRFGLLSGRQSITDVLAEAVGALLLLLAWRYRRDRLAASAVMVAAVNLLIRNEMIVWPDLKGATVLAVALALDLTVLAVTRDRPLGRPVWAVWLIAIAAQLWFAVFGVHLVPEPAIGMLADPRIAPGALIGATVVVAAGFVVRRSAFAASLAWVAVAATLAILDGRDPHDASMLLAAAQLTLLVGVFEDSYRLAFHDELTGLAARRALNDTVRNLRGDFSIAMVDIDHFKRFNDRHGHDAGDQVLRMVADELAKTGGGGRAYRWGGEEFALVYPGKTVAELREVLEELRSSIANRKFALRAPDRPRTKPEAPVKSAQSPKRVTVTVSIGLAGTSSRRRSADAVLQAADRALYRAKRAGRNRVVAAGDRLKKSG
jgi:diguanylate cyclase (GGDEF)-like protein